MEPTAIADGVWGIEESLSIGPGMRMPARATVVRLANGDVVLHSPLRLDDEAAAAISKLGPVKAILAPNTVHWMFARAAKERFPEATLYGAPGLEKKLGEFTPLPADGFVADGLRSFLVAGAPRMNEHVFLYEKTLIVTDLVMNIHRDFSALMSVFLRINGVHGRFAHSRMWKIMGADAAAMSQSLTTIANWEFDRIVPAHGDIKEDNARAELARVLHVAPAGTAPSAPRETAPAA
jgi:hypothetical protein